MKRLASLMFTALVSFSVNAQTSSDALSAEQLKALVSGKTWALTFGGDLKDPSRTAYWDFKPDGSVCGRLHGDKQGSKCADTGNWKLQGDVLCWNFEWIGVNYGYKSTCKRVRRADGKFYELIDPEGKMQAVPFYPLETGRR